MANYRVQNPVTDEVLETFDQATDEDIQTILADTQKAYETWSTETIEHRADLVRKLAQALRDGCGEYAVASCKEMGKSRPEMESEIIYAAEILEYYADHGAEFLADEPLPGTDGKARIRKRPTGPLLGIMPWNFPWYQVARFIGPNLVLGNTIVLKHADICPTTALTFQRLCEEVGMPKGTYLNVFASHGQIAEIIADDRIQGVSLTGSERAGAIIAEQAGKNLKKAVLELGGTDPYIVLDTDDVKKAAKLAWATRMYNTGQACNSNKRIIVMDDIYDEFVAELSALAGAMKPTTPEEAAKDGYCPLSSRSAAEDLARQIQAAVDEGATLHVGGELADEGAYLSPAVLTDVPRDSKSFYAEFFGPVAEIYRVSSDEEAVKLANDSAYGLGSAVFSSDANRAERVADQISAGMVHINIPVSRGAHLPFGGVKRSGYGRELGPLGIDEFVNKQMYYVED